MAAVREEPPSYQRPPAFLRKLMARVLAFAFKAASTLHRATRKTRGRAKKKKKKKKCKNACVPLFFFLTIWPSKGHRNEVRVCVRGRRTSGAAPDT